MSYLLGHFFVIILLVMIYLTNAQLAFCIVIPILVVGILLAVLYLLFYKKWIKNNFEIYCYRKVNRIATYRDYYLINNYTFNSDDINTVVINHILFGDKYIYVIQDRFIDGDLTGKDTDSDLIVINKNGSKNYAGGNPYLQSNNLLRQLSANTGIGTELMVAVTLVNDDCRINISSSSKQFFVVQRKKLSTLLKIIESRNVGKINASSLAKAVEVLSKNNLRDK